MTFKIPGTTNSFQGANRPQFNVLLEDEESAPISVPSSAQAPREEEDMLDFASMKKMLEDTKEESDDENTLTRPTPSFAFRKFSAINPLHQDSTDAFPSQVASTSKKSHRFTTKHVQSANEAGFMGAPSAKKLESPSKSGAKRIHHRKSRDDSSKKVEGFSRAPSKHSKKAPKDASISEVEGSVQDTKKGPRKSRHTSSKHRSLEKDSRRIPKSNPYASIREEAEPVNEIMLTKEELFAAKLELQKKYLDKSRKGLVDRTGAFEYPEIFYSSLNVVGEFRANVESPSLEQLLEDDVADIEEQTIHREKALSPEMRRFFDTNLQLLQNEMNLLQEKLGPQIGNFKEILDDFAQLKLEKDAGKTIDPARLVSIKKRLHKLELELKRTAAVIQENQLAFQPFALIRSRIESGEIKGLSLMDFDGKVSVTIPSSKEPSRDLLKDCQLASELYKAYPDSILDPHFFYCSKFLTAITKFKSEELSSFNLGSHTPGIKV